jgi:putative MATE family efflux protein
MKKDLTQGSPIKVLFMFAMPMLLGNVFQQAYNLTDSIVVGKFVGEQALAAVGSSFMLLFLMVSLAIGFGIGCSVVISQYYGAKQYDKVKQTIMTCLLTYVVAAVLLTIIGQIITVPLLKLMQCPVEIFDYSVEYLRFIFGGLIFTFLYNAGNSIFVALGDSKSSMYFLMIATVINIVLDLYFVLALNMAVVGVALATLIAQAVAAGCSMWLLYRRMHTLSDVKVSWFDYPILKQVARMGIPSMLQQSFMSVAALLMQSLVNSYGVEFVAAMVSAQKLDSLAMMPMLNVSNALSTFSAQNIGAGKVERIKEGFIAALKLSILACLMITVILLVFGRSMLGWFTNANTPPGVIVMGYQYISIVALSYVVMAVLFNTNGVLKGSGDMKMFMVSSMASLTSRVLLAYGLSRLIGYWGVFFAIPLGWGVGMVISLWRYRLGTWQNKALVKIPEEVMYEG